MTDYLGPTTNAHEVSHTTACPPLPRHGPALLLRARTSHDPVLAPPKAKGPRDWNAAIFSATHMEKLFIIKINNRKRKARWHRGEIFSVDSDDDDGAHQKRPLSNNCSRMPPSPRKDPTAVGSLTPGGPGLRKPLRIHTRATASAVRMQRYNHPIRPFARDKIVGHKGRHSRIQACRDGPAPFTYA